ncbi:hypothetical protein BJX99DRAFT_266479 [Aspergillus californicus]
MDEPSAPIDAPMQEHHIVRADEVDQTGMDISTVPDDQMMQEVAEGIRQEQAAAQSPPDPAGEAAPQEAKASRRPELRRNAAAPPPPLQPPPPAPIQRNADGSTDSLSLAQLRQLVHEMPKVEQPAYAFDYADSQPFPEEIEEWFQYSEFDRAMLLRMKSSFEDTWSSFCQNLASVSSHISWIDAPKEMQKSFLNDMLDNLQDSEVMIRIEALEVVCYALTGVWGHTAGKSVSDFPISSPVITEVHRSKSLQILWMENNAKLIHECAGIQPLYGCLLRAFEKFRVSATTEPNGPAQENVTPASLAAAEREGNLVLTAFYVMVEISRRQETQDPLHAPLKDGILALEPDLMVFLVEIIARLRWDESANVPLTRIILLFWKCILLIFGGSDSLKKAKEALEPAFEGGKNDPTRRTPFLTASPLDYHNFRQEITSKYPAYNPPAAAIPLELDNNSILPPLPQHPSRSYSSNGLFSGVGPSVAGGNGSILHQSVHIATPAPSPPPSPIGPGGKAGKKQNYQTNQNFPFMYPPLNDSSNDLGGKGTTEKQDVLVGKKWDGSDVPASIIEAGRLFSTHVKTTRAMRQLWAERERFMKHDRGWHAEGSTYAAVEDEVADKLQDFILQDTQPKTETSKQRETDDENIQQRLEAVEAFYTHALVHLQSIVIVFLKIVLTNVSALVNSQGNGQNGPSTSESFNGANGSAPSFNNDTEDLNCDATIDELDNIRLREITGKAISGSLLLLVKWFKRSHIMKFEYMTQLLLDSNYLPLILKMFAHQDVDQAVAQRTDRDELGFFRFCHLHSEQPPDIAAGLDEDSDDDAAPPPIARHRQKDATPDQPGAEPLIDEAGQEFVNGPHRPEVDELGYPTGPPPSEPITTFSFRNFFSAINYLHIMQKITRDKAHRCLLLVQYKSSTILRKGLKIPDPHLRFYTLKLFKSQVPYCGRKWRQSNMRVITAIYLYCRPELRDDWLAGSDIDAEVEEALPLEQALRGLTHWWHLRGYKHVMGGEEDATIIDEERDFFVRELEAMGWGFVGDELMNGMTDEAELAAGGPMVNGTEWDGMLQGMEGN